MTQEFHSGNIFKETQNITLKEHEHPYFIAASFTFSQDLECMGSCVAGKGRGLWSPYSSSNWKCLTLCKMPVLSHEVENLIGPILML